MDVCTSSDHGAVVAMIELGHLMSPYSVAEVLKRKYERMVYLYDEATKEDWERYRKKLDGLLKEKISLQDMQCFSKTRESETNKKRINEWWDLISNGIIATVSKTIPK